MAFFFSVLTPDAMQPNAVINLAYAGAVILTMGLSSAKLSFVPVQISNVKKRSPLAASLEDSDCSPAAVNFPMDPDYVNNSENRSPLPSVIGFWVHHQVDEGPRQP